MLPFQKRNVNQAADLSTEDVVEVVHKVRQAASFAPSSQKLGTTLRSNSGRSVRSYDRPRVPAPVPASSRSKAPVYAAEQVGEDEDEMTCLMPAKNLTIPPPATSRRVPPPPPAKMMSSNTSFRPAPSPQHFMYPHESTPRDARTPAQRIARVQATPQPMAVLAARQETGVMPQIPQAPASLSPMAMPSTFDSEPHIHPGATVLTARTLKARPTASWAAALVAMGIFAGLVTAAVARGDFNTSADQKVTVAAASQGIGDQVIPQQPASSPALPSYTSAGQAAPMAISAPVSSPANAIAAPAAKAESTTVVAAKLSPTPKAAPKAAPAVAHVSKHEAPAVEKTETAAKDETPKEDKKVAKASKKEKGDSSLASAKEAQALADAQLAASL